MRALSIRQPWAWLIVNGHKDIENRTWPTRYRGPVLIHASKTMTGQEYQSAIYSVWCIDKQLADRMPQRKGFEQGGIVGQAEIAGCVQDSDSDWFNGPYGFVLRNVRALPFVPWKGELGFFEVELPS